MIEGGGRAVGTSLHQFTIGIEVDELLGHLLDILLHAGSGFSPTCTAQAIEPWDVALGAAITLHLVQPVERHIQGVAAGELQN